ncbi:MAG: NAD(P)-dependent oxidoreductase [Desulfobacula sp.]|uniref:NAD(P)-dependent oxidoreductase n=1 Tax=Desulfobacula sp. TaxID=2593537 RepID=UPI0025C0B0D5|nr:NAD(P)-dependent oxidoreductase [Desulfobacula sp.]MCD4718652.1 NAD(P)-dependent oxidoreductase [Desulfobacula sp.]
MIKKVGFIGLGAMGKGMAFNLLNAGFDMSVYDLNPEILKTFEQAGAKIADSPKELARVSDVVMTMLPEPEHVESVYLEKDGLLEGAHEGLYLIDSSTVDPECNKKMCEAAAKVGVTMFDAPVGGSPNEAAAGNLVMLAGGKKKDMEACRPVLDVVGQLTLFCGPIGMGSAVKLANNLMTMNMMATVVEGYTLAEDAGVDTKVLAELQRLNVPRVFDMMVLMFMAKVDNVGFQTILAHKDVRLALKMAEDTGTPLPVGSLVKSLLQLNIRQGRGKLGLQSSRRIYLKEDDKS